MRPDRIVLGEVRGAEAIDMMQAMNTGHEGSMATIHANSPRDALSRLENMISLSGMNLPAKVMRHQISAALTAIVQVARLTDGRRKLVSIQEITGMEGDIITMQELYAFRQTGIANDGTVQGHFAATGLRPKFGDRMKSFGITLPDSLFDPTRQYE
jgi:pilus assembly protein CpaF